VAITLTENAAHHIRRSLEKRGKGVALRLGVKKVGCSGFAYTFDYADEVGANDALFESNDAAVVVDKESLPFLDGTTLDFVKDGFKETFRFDNPNVKSQCGCGESFSIS
jgi:iron-sulfur cluster assembly protein